MSDWECTLFDDDGEHALRVRESLVMSLSLNKCNESERANVFSRYLKGWFDSVSVNHLVVGRVFAYTSIPITRTGVRGRFLQFPGLLDEVDHETKFGDIGRKNIALIDLPKFTYDGAHDHSILGFRSKLAGSRFVKTVVGPKTYLRGYRDIEVPQDFPVELCEEFSGIFYILYPYGMEAPEGKYKIPGVYFEPHPWISPSEFSLDEASEGVMVLTPHCEYRVKKVPTEEILDHGIWEVAYGIRYGTGVSGLMQIRPRPGKKPMTKDQAIKVLKSVVKTADLLRNVPESTRPIFVVHSGLFRGMVIAEQDGIIIDCGLRDSVKTVQIQDPASEVPRTLRKAKPQLDDVPAYLYGSKLLVVSQREKCVAFGIRIEREGKALDFPGGTRELGETPLACLTREVWEELNFDITPSGPTYLGKSASEVRKDGYSDACSDVYVVAAGNLPYSATSDFEWIMYSDIAPLSQGRKAKVAEWIPRILRFVQSQFSSAESLMSVVCGDASVDPRSIIDGYEKNPFDFKGWPACTWSMTSKIVYVEVPSPLPLLPRKHAFIAPAPVERNVPDFSQVNPVVKQVLRNLKEHEYGRIGDDDALKQVVVPLNTSVPTRTPILSQTPAQNAPMGETRVLHPPFISMERLVTLNYAGPPSTEMKFYFVCYQILTAGSSGVLTKDLYQKMRRHLNLGTHTAGRVLDDMIKCGWFRRVAEGNDHRVTMNFGWQYD